MLKNLSIGTKLLWGFFLLILLAVLVGGVGYLGLHLVKVEVEYMNDLNEINTIANKMIDDANTARVASNKFVIDKQDSYTQELKKSIENILTAATDLEKKIKGNERCDNTVVDELEKMKIAAGKYQDEHNHYVKEYAKKLDCDKIRMDAAGKTEKAVSELLASMDETTKKNAEAEGGKIDVARVELMRDAALLLEKTKQIRISIRDFELRINDPVARKEVSEKANQQGFATIEAFKNIQARLHTDQDRKLVDNALDNLGAWKGSFDENVKANLNMVDSIEAKNTIATDFMNSAKKITGMISANVNECEKGVVSINSTGTVFIIVAIIVGIILGIGMGLVLRNDITSGIKTVTQLMDTIANQGDISVTVPESILSRRDETGNLAKAANMVLGDYKRIDQMANSLALGDWRVKVASKGSLDTMNQNLAKMLEQVTGALAKIDTSVQQVANGSKEVSAAAQSLSSGAQESAASLEQISASMNEISGQTRKNAESAAQARDLANGATQAAQGGQTAMSEMTGAMDRITKNSSEIQRVIKVIDDIAFQTNLLALNAAVEAARAGQHGKGFAVVAEEVRNLAARSAKAAKETTELIATSDKEIQHGGQIASKTADVLNRISEQIKETTDLIAGIAVASNEQAQGVGQITAGLQQIDAVTQQNTASAEESASVANEMSSMAFQLQELVGQFKLR